MEQMGTGWDREASLRVGGVEKVLECVQRVGGLAQRYESEGKEMKDKDTDPQNGGRWEGEQ